MRIEYTDMYGAYALSQSSIVVESGSADHLIPQSLFPAIFPTGSPVFLVGFRSVSSIIFHYFVTRCATIHGSTLAVSPSHGQVALEETNGGEPMASPLRNSESYR